MVADKSSGLGLLATETSADKFLNPCLQTLLTTEEEWSSMEEWQGLMVASDCTSNLWVWDHQNNDVLLQIETTGYRCGPENTIVLWDSRTVYLWDKSDDETPEPVFKLTDECIATLIWLSKEEILIATENGNLYSFNVKQLELAEVLRNDDNRWLCMSKVSSDTFLVYQKGWNETWDEESEEYDEDETELDDGDCADEEDSEEWIEDEDCDDEGEYEEDGEYDEDEEWEESEEEPSDPTILLCERATDGVSFEIRELCTVENQVGSIYILDDKFVVLDKSGQVLLYEMSSGTLLHAWSLFQGIGTDVYVLSDTHICVSQWDEDSNFVVNVLSTLDCDTVISLEGHTDLISDMKGLSENRAITTSFDNTAIVWDCSNGEELLKIHNIVPHDLSGVIVLNEHQVAVWSVSGHILIWDIQTQEHLGTLMGHTSSVSDLIQLSDGRLASVAMFEPSLRIWEPSMAPLKPPIDNHDDVVIHPLSVRNGLVLTASHDKTIRVWNAKEATCLRVFKEHTQPLECVDWISDNEIVSADWDGVLLRWNLDGDVLQRYEGHTDWVRGFSPLPNGLLLSWSDDADLRVWDMVSGECIATLEGHEAPVRGGLFLDDTRWLSWSEDSTLRIWSVDQFECLAVLDGHASQIDIVRLLDDGRVVASNYEDIDVPTVVTIWDGSSGTKQQTFTGLDADVIELTVVENRLYVRTYANIWEWDFAQPEHPTEWLLRDFKEAKPNIWKQLHPKQFAEFEPFDQVITDGGKVSFYHKEILSRWIGDGNWKVQALVDGHTMVATCWNDVAFLEMHSQ